MNLEEAQAAKKRHIAAKLDLQPGQKVLDIGCGWGGLALSLAQAADVSVRGVTLSDEQLTTARARAAAQGLAGRVSFSLTDYRDIDGQFDRIVSVGMFEHVGRPNYQAFFDAIAERLTDDGVALIHSIGRASGPSTTDRFTAKYIFPRGYIPALSHVGVLSRRGRNGLPLRRPHELPDPAEQKRRRPADHPRLHRRGRAGAGAARTSAGAAAQRSAAAEVG